MITVTNVDVLVSATEREGHEATPPDMDTLDKIGFLFNNLVIQTVHDKVRNERRRL